MTISGVTGYPNPYSTQAAGVAQAGATRASDSDDDGARVQQHRHEGGDEGGDRGGMLGFMDSIFKALGQLGLVPGAPATGSSAAATGTSSSSTVATTAATTTSTSTAAGSTGATASTATGAS